MNPKTKKTILLVEDEAIIALSEANIIRSFGYKVVTARNGESAIAYLLENKKVNLILMDLDLGRGIGGAETAKRILDKQFIPILFLSSHFDSDFAKNVEHISHSGCLKKSSSDNDLHHAIRLAIN